MVLIFAVQLDQKIADRFIVIFGVIFKVMSINIFSSVKFRFILLYIITDKIKNVYEKLRLET